MSRHKDQEIEGIYCVPRDEHRHDRVNVALAGGGLITMELLDFMREYGLLGRLVNLVGIYDPDRSAPVVRRAGLENIFTTTEYAALFEKEKVDMVLDFSDTREVGRTLALETPPGVSVVDHLSATFLWNVIRGQDEKIRREKRTAHTIRLESLTEMTLFLADEMRNPLMAIGGFAISILKMEGIGPRAQQRAELILKEAKRLEGVINKILGFVRPLPLKKEVDNINRVVQAAVDRFDGEIKMREIDLELHLDAEIPQCLMDSHQMEEVVSGLVSNSLDALEERGTLSIHTELCWDDFLIAVKDTGTGMDRATQERILNPFFSTKIQRAGIGLAMCRKIIEDHGGEITVFSEAGEGTLVKVVVPLAF